MNEINSFRETVLRVVRSIPRGKTISYKQVAAAAGSPKAYRAVGNILNKNHDKTIPCHRVVRTDGSAGGYNGLRGDKKMLLELEARLHTKKPT
jgi:O-6-methylguanine DNA methyltransferase